MREIGAWLRENGESIYGTRGGIFEPVDHVYGSTCKGNHVYIHIIDQDAFRKETLPAVSYKITKCLCHGKEIPFTQDETGIKISLPEDLKKEADTIVTLELSEEVKPAENQEIHFTGKR